MKDIYEMHTDNLLQGPRVKSKASFDLEKIIDSFLDPKKNEVSCSYNLVGELEIKVNDYRYNLTKILQYADFEHLQLDQKKLDQYPEFLKKKSMIKPALSEILPEEERGYNVFPSPEDFENRDKDNVFNYLSYAEKLAINIYTGNLYSEINSFLRQNGKIQEYTVLDQKILTKKIKEILLATCIASVGLSKFDNDSNLVKDKKEEFEEFYRFEESTKMKPVLEKRTEDIQSEKLTVNQSFLSTSEIQDIFFNKYDVSVKVTQPVGLNPIGKKISLLAFRQEEKEVLFAPGTQFKFYQVESPGKNKNYEFEAIPVRTIDNIDSTPYSNFIQIQNLSEALTKRHQHLVEKSKGSQITDHRSQITDHRSQITDHRSQMKYAKYTQEISKISGFLNKLRGTENMDPQTQQTCLEETVSAMKESGYIEKLKEDPHRTARKVLSVIGVIAATLSIVGIGALLADHTHRKKYGFGLFDQSHQKQKREKQDIMEAFNSSEEIITNKSFGK